MSLPANLSFDLNLNREITSSAYQKCFVKSRQEDVNSFFSCIGYHNLKFSGVCFKELLLYIFTAMFAK